jgi:carboxylesterase type B
MVSRSDFSTLFFLSNLLLSITSASYVPTSNQSCNAVPTVEVLNGTYAGFNLPAFNQDLFLGMPYAQPPVGELRFHVPESLNSTWEGTRNATEYSLECIGYGGDDWLLGNPVSEDCLTINVVRPEGVADGSDLPVAVWIYGGGYFEGGSLDPRYNLSLLIQQSQSMGTPFIGVSLNYRVAEWGFLFSQELLDAGATNLGLRDQRLALHWVQENIKSFGGDPAKVTIWGESAGAFSVGAQYIAYGGRDDNLFRGAIQQSGSVSFGGRFPDLTTQQPVYDAVINAANCTSSTDTLACLRTIPSETLNSIFNSSVTTGMTTMPVIDGDFIQGSPTTQLRNGEFVKVPLLLGTNFDEGTAFSTRGINTDEQFLDMVYPLILDNSTAETIAALYPNIPEIGIPATMTGTPSASLGTQFKRSAAFNGDWLFHAPCRLTSQMWAKHNQTAFSYHFNVLVNGVSSDLGATHFQEVAFVFHNIEGQGYTTAITENPFENEPDTFPALSNIMSRMWVSFIVNLDPNSNNGMYFRHPTT